jgi:hypothetical protein
LLLEDLDPGRLGTCGIDQNLNTRQWCFPKLQCKGQTPTWCNLIFQNAEWQRGSVDKPLNICSSISQIWFPRHKTRHAFQYLRSHRVHPALDSRRRTSREGEEHKGIKTERDREMGTSTETNRDTERDRAPKPTTQKIQATRSRHDLTHCHDAGKKNTRIEDHSRHGCHHPCFFGRTIFEHSTCEEALSALASCAFPSHNTTQSV